MTQINKRTAEIVWTGDELNFTGKLGSGYEFNVGSPSSEQIGSPMEFLLAGVASCTAVDVAHILQKMRQSISGLRVEITGIRAETNPKVYTTVDLVYVVQGQDVEADAVERAIQLSMETYCSASAMFQQAGVTFATDYRIESH